MVDINLDRLIVPIYINEKIVLDMLAIMEDGFSMVSQINYTEHKKNHSAQLDTFLQKVKEI
ncbi:hypothetical protein [Streptobacillus notomytis]|nr:hypothetical protein [Streptobacillus notomytis]